MLQRGVRVGVVACVVVIAAFGLVYLLRAVDRLDDTASTNASMNFDDREFGGGNSLVVDKGALYEARALIPKDETYRIVAGPGVKGATELTQPYIDQFARYFLMPLRPASDARWILCYGCSRSELGDRFKVVWRNGEGSPGNDPVTVRALAGLALLNTLFLGVGIAVLWAIRGWASRRELARLSALRT